MDVTGGKRALYNEELLYFSSSGSFLRTIKEAEVVAICSTLGRDGKCSKNYGLKKRKEPLGRPWHDVEKIGYECVD
jgi:hypothetical protein